MTGNWRVGTKVGRTLYRDEKLVGMVDSVEMAAEIAYAMNLKGKCPCCGAWPCACVREGFATNFADVRAFQVGLGLVVRDAPTILPPADYARRIRLILEEVAELAEAHAAGDLPEFADALADLVWVVLGTGVEAGIPFDAVWEAVRSANMAKLGGKLDASGKLQKPPGWAPPDVAGVLARASPNPGGDEGVRTWP